MKQQLNFLSAQFLGRMGAGVFTAAFLFLTGEVHAQITPLADTPVRATSKVPANVMLALSVEWPTGVVQAYNDESNSICPGRDGSSDSVCYVASKTYIGYFDPFKCYTYDTTSNYFLPAGYAIGATVMVPNAGLKTCSGQWSGNLLNWATMQTTDMFRWAMTGGDRFTDTSTLTVLEKARHDGQGGFGQFPIKRIGGANVGGGPVIQPVLPSTVTPFTSGQLFMRIQGLNTVMWVSKARAPVTGNHPITTNNPNNTLDVPAPSAQTYTEEGLCAAYAGPGTCTQVVTASTGTRTIRTQVTSTNEAGQCPVAGSVSCVNTAAPVTGTRQYQYTRTAAGITCPSGDANQTACSQASTGTRTANLSETGQCPFPAEPVTTPATTYSGCTNTVVSRATVTRIETGTSSCVGVTNPSGTTFVSCTPGSLGTRSYLRSESGSCPPGAPPAGTTYAGCGAGPAARQAVYTESGVCPPAPLPAGYVSCSAVGTGQVTVIYRENGACNPAPLPSGFVSCSAAGGGRRDIRVSLPGTCATFSPALTGTQTLQSCTVATSPTRSVTVIEPGICPRGAVAGQTVTSCGASATRSYTVTEAGQCPAGAPPAGVTFGSCSNVGVPNRTIVRTENGTCATVTAGFSSCALVTAGTRTYNTAEPGQCARAAAAGVTVNSCGNTSNPSILVTAVSSGQCPATVPSGGVLVAGSCMNLIVSSIGTRTVVRNVDTVEAGQCAAYVGAGTCTNTTAPQPTSIRQITGEMVSVTPYYVRVKVCDPALAETQTPCTLYGNGTSLKPTGTIQENALDMRFGAFGYLLDNGSARDGGVLRAKMKDVGPMKSVPLNPAVTNTAAEWSATTGVFVNNPDAADATATGFSATNSGVVNYLNKFGRRSGYKSFDPVSEMYAEVIKYFKAGGRTPTTSYVSGLDNFNVDGFPVITSWNDPIQYSCQQNFVIAISDSNTHKDKNLNGGISNAENEPAAPGNLDTDYNVRTWTNAVGSLESSMVAPIANPSGGTVGANLDTLRNCCNGSAFLAGLAYYAHTQDLRPDFDNINGRQSITSFFVDVREAGSWGTTGDPRNQLWLAAKYGGFKDVNDNQAFNGAVGSIGPDTWQDTVQSAVQGYPVPTNYFAANQPEKLVAGLQRAFSDIRGVTGSGAGVGVAASNLSETTGENGIYQVTFATSDWTGTVKGSEIAGIDEATGVIALKSPAFEAGELLRVKALGSGWDTGRVIVTAVPGAGQLGQPFRVLNLNAAQLAALGPTAIEQQDVLNYLRGQKTFEENDVNGAPIVGGKYRTRKLMLADVVDSEAVYVGKPNAGYFDEFNAGYSAFKTAKAARTPIIYVGANAGQLHAFNAIVNPLDPNFSNRGKEVMAFVPSLMYAGPNNTPSVDGLRSLTLTSGFVHHYFVNATPSQRDIDFNKTDGNMTTTPEWRTVLVGGLGKGGRGYYALDVTDPADFASEASAATKVLWEFSDEDMGYTYGFPIITKTRKWGWVVLVSSGYNNITSSVVANRGKGFLYILNARTGALLQKISTGVGTATNPAGFSPITAFTPSLFDYTTDEAYGGDLLGNVWRFDFKSATAAVPAPLLFATLEDASSVAQPITAMPQVEYSVTDGKRYVFVGTGRFLDQSDIANAQQQSFYAIRDGSVDSRFELTASTTGEAVPTTVTFPITRSILVNNTNLVTGLTPAQISANPMGWYYELLGVVNSPISPFPPVARERVSLNPKASQGIITWVGNKPDINACNPNGTSRQYACTYAGCKSLLYSQAVSGTKTYEAFIETRALVKSQLVNVDDGVRILGTDDKGVPFLIGRSLTPLGGGRLLNWREVLQ